AQQLIEDRRRGVDEYVPCVDSPLSTISSRITHRCSSAICIDACSRCSGNEYRARLVRRTRQRLGNRTHAADRHAPLTSPVADHVVEEAPVLGERGIVRMALRADQRICQHDAAHVIVSERLLDDLAERPLQEWIPERTADGLAD